VKQSGLPCPILIDTHAEWFERRVAGEGWQAEGSKNEGREETLENHHAYFCMAPRFCAGAVLKISNSLLYVCNRRCRWRAAWNSASWVQSTVQLKFSQTHAAAADTRTCFSSVFKAFSYLDRVAFARNVA
jgi:hypothetical protein